MGSMRLGMWRPPDVHYENVEDYVAACRHAFYPLNEIDRVASTTVAYGIGDTHKLLNVSTVFLGIDVSFYEDSPPVLWETMVFGFPDAKDGWDESDCNRYASPKSATAGHKEMLTVWQAALDVAGYPILATVTARCRWWTE